MAKVAAEIGSTANKYEILAKLATGGMADIFLARGESVAEVERYCVLKRILRERAGDAQLVQMFLEEARLAAQLQHPNIASVYDVGKLGESYFFTMEYVHGETVRSLLQRATSVRRPVPLACALTIVAGAAAGLHHAHERNGNDGRPLGIVHRDVSPSNVMISYEGHVKVVDFGVAKASHRAVETKSGTVKGKISYLSPEQCRGERVDRRSDLFSLGIVMWEMLTGKRLYRRDSDFGNMSAIVYDAAVPPSRVRPELPPEVDAIVLRLLAKPVADRFQSADEVVDEIESVAVRAGIMISAAAVGRFVRDLFGRRPEPWLELAPKAASSEPITLTNASIPTGPELAAANQIEVQLANLAELSLNSAPSVDLAETDPHKPAARPITGSLPPTVPLGVVRGGSPVELIIERPAAPAALPSPPTGPAPDAAPQAAIPAPPPVAKPDDAPLAPTLSAPAPSDGAQAKTVATEAAPAEAAPLTTTGPHPSPAQHGSRLRSSAPYTLIAPRALAKIDREAPTAIVTPPSLLSAGSGPRPAIATPIVARPEPVAPRRPRGRLVALISAALLCGVIAAWWTARSGDEFVFEAPKVVPRDEPVRHASPPDVSPEDLQQVAAAAIQDAPREDPQPVRPVAQDAAPEEAAPERSSTPGTDPAPPPRAVAVPPRRSSPRAPHPIVPAEAAPPEPSVPSASPPTATTPPLDVLRTLYRAEKYADVVRTCTSEITAELAELCARAACKEGQSARADSWMALIGSKQARLKTSAACQQDVQNRLAPEVAACDAAPMKQSRASSCTLAACRLADPAKALKWVAYVPAALRAALITQCRQSNVDLTTQTLDCTTEAAACP